MRNEFQSSFVQVLSQLIGSKGKEVKDSDLLKAFSTFAMIESFMPTDIVSAYEKTLSKANKDSVLAFTILKKFVSNTYLLSQAYNKFTSITLKEFLRFVVPNLVCNPVEALQIIERYKQKTYEKIYQILAVKKVAFDSQQEKRPPKNKMQELLWKRYISLVDGQKIYQNDFLSLYQNINYYPLDTKESNVNNDAMKAVTAWSELGESIEHQLEYASLFYVKKFQARELITIYPANSVEDNDSKRDKLFYASIKILAKYYPIDFLCAVKLDRNNNDIALENGLIYTQITSNLYSESGDINVLIYCPTPFFIQKWIRDPMLRKVKTTFILDDIHSRNLLNHNYLSNEYRSDCYDISFEVRDKYEKKIREEGRIDYDVILFFAAQVPMEQQDESIKLWKKYSAKTLELYLLVATNEFENAVSPLSKELKDKHINIDSILLLPQGINGSTSPRRKLFLRCTLRKSRAYAVEDRKEENAIAEYCDSKKTELYSFPLNIDWNKQLLSMQIREPVRASKSDLQALNKSIRDYYRTEILRRKSNGETKEEPISYEFTSELMIWFSKSYPKNNLGRPRLEAYICYPPPPEKVIRGYMERGAQIDSTTKHTTKLGENEIFEWLEQVYPFEYVRERRNKRFLSDLGANSSGENAACGANDESSVEPNLKPRRSIQEEIIAVYGPIYEKKPLSLKMLWYLYPCLQDIYSDNDYAIFSDMVHTELGMLKLDRETTEKHYVDGMNKAYPDASAKDLRLMWMLLSQAVDFAVTRGHCENNVLNEVVDSVNRGRDLFAEVRDALTKKSFTLTEMKKLYDALQNKIVNEDKPEYIGVLIRLLTGLESNIVCGLKWDDLVFMRSFDFYQLWIRRQVTNDGSTYVGFTHKEDYRRFPCPPILVNYLNAHKKRIKHEYPAVSQRDFSNLPIVSTREKLEYPETRYSVFSPRKLERISKEIVGYAEIQNNVIMVPDSKLGTKETNLAHYQGDIFRSNFRFYALEIAKMTDGELMYLLGNKPNTTFCRYYCDFLNDAAQLTMFVKLKKWDALFTAPQQCYAISKKVSGIRSFEITEEVNCAYPLQLNMEVGMVHKGEIIFSAKSQYGIDLMVSQLSEAEREEK